MRMDIHSLLAFGTVNELPQLIRINRLWCHFAAPIGGPAFACDFGENMCLDQDPSAIRTILCRPPINDGLHEFLLASRAIDVGWTIQRDHAISVVSGLIQPSRRLAVSARQDRSTIGKLQRSPAIGTVHGLIFRKTISKVESEGCDKHSSTFENVGQLAPEIP